jgi:endonuclease/exonuclease/phosphatase family metal-dependent hydrolase
MSPPIRIVSYNVRYFSHRLRGLASTRRSMDNIAAALAALEPRPQIICLQEVESRSVRSSIAAGAPRETQLDTFVRALGQAFLRRGLPSPYRAQHFSAHVAGPAERPLYTTGLAVLIDESQLTVAAHDAIALTGGEDGGERRICAHVELRTAAARALHVFNAHLSLPSRLVGTRLGHGANQLAQARRLTALVRERAGRAPFIVCGDFNARPSSPVHRHFLETERLAAPAAGPSPTAGVGPFRMCLDYLFAGNGVEWLDVEGTRSFGDGDGGFHGLSDHVPLIARFDCKDASIVI